MEAEMGRLGAVSASMDYGFRPLHGRPDNTLPGKRENDPNLDFFR